VPILLPVAAEWLFAPGALRGLPTRVCVCQQPDIAGLVPAPMHTC
jgi:hypothetical protein